MNNPFRYKPQPAVTEAALEIQNIIEENTLLNKLFNPGKMLGVLIVEVPDNYTQMGLEKDEQLLHYLPDGTIYLAGFSGNIGETNLIPGFVPPVYNLLEPKGHFKQGELEISKINLQIREIEESPEYRCLMDEIRDKQANYAYTIEQMKDEILRRKLQRDKLRMTLEVGSPELEVLTRESQFDKAQLRRKKKEYQAEIDILKSQANAFVERISSLKLRRANLSDELQKWIFKQFRLRNYRGEMSNIWDIFQAHNIVPPAGSGECAAPKLLQYAYEHGMKPLYMGEFWYGESPQGSIRTQGHFYPSCSSKCGIILPYMLQGLDIEDDIVTPNEGADLKIIFEDNYLLAIDKPSGIPSVPGLDGRKSAFEILSEYYPGLEIVHRLDMDTSGLLLFAKSSDSAKKLRKQFENRQIKKTYKALLMKGTKNSKPLALGQKGEISLPLAPDYEDKPRQKVDYTHGKIAVTEFEIIALRKDGTTEILFHPLDGRTHQLRVHSAHKYGLGRPIVGDCLYGGSTTNLPLQLRAIKLSFTHPYSGQWICLSI